MTGDKQMLGITTVLAVAASLISAPAPASDWTKIGTDGDGRTWSVDSGSIRLTGELAHAWKRVEISNPSPYPPTGELVAVALFLEYTDCAKGIVGVKESKLFSADGSLIASHVDPDEKIQWQSAAPGSFLDSTLQVVCNKAGREFNGRDA